MRKENIFLVIGLALFSVFGACAKWLNLKEKESLATLFREAFTAAFSGILVYFVYRWTSIDVSLAFIVAGLAGWIGAKAVDYIGKYIAQKSGISLKKEE